MDIATKELIASAVLLACVLLSFRIGLVKGRKIGFSEQFPTYIHGERTPLLMEEQEYAIRAARNFFTERGLDETSWVLAKDMWLEAHLMLRNTANNPDSNIDDMVKAARHLLFAELVRDEAGRRDAAMERRSKTEK